MPFTTLWAPNQAAIKQKRQYTFTAPSGVGNTYSAAINGKTVTYTSVNGDTAATAATALYNLLNVSTSIAPELTEINFANPSSGVLTAEAGTAGTPFAGVPGTSAGLVLSTGNGLANGIATVELQANASPSDVNDPQNWLRINTGVQPPAQARSLPQGGDAVVLASSAVPMLWNLDQLGAVAFGSFTRRTSMTGQIGLPANNAAGYAEWRAQYFRFSGPAGSVPAGGLAMLLGYDDGAGSGPSLERYDVRSQPVTLTILGAGQVDFLGVATANTFNVVGQGTLNVAMAPGEVAQLGGGTINSAAALNVGPGVTWTAGVALTMLGGAATLNAAPATVTMSNGAQLTVRTDALAWSTITAQGNCDILFAAGGTLTTLTMSQGCTLTKDGAGMLTITNATIDGDTCRFVDLMNGIIWTNAVSVRQQVSAGPFQFTGTRTVKVT